MPLLIVDTILIKIAYGRLLSFKSLMLLFTFVNRTFVYDLSNILHTYNFKFNNQIKNNYLILPVYSLFHLFLTPKRWQINQ